MSLNLNQTIRAIAYIKNKVETERDVVNTFAIVNHVNKHLASHDFGITQADAELLLYALVSNSGLQLIPGLKLFVKYNTVYVSIYKIPHVDIIKPIDKAPSEEVNPVVKLAEKTRTALDKIEDSIFGKVKSTTYKIIPATLTDGTKVQVYAKANVIDDVLGKLGASVPTPVAQRLTSKIETEFKALGNENFAQFKSDFKSVQSSLNPWTSADEIIKTVISRLGRRKYKLSKKFVEAYFKSLV